ncbi:glucose-6-phosphate/phosphate translocator 1, chloroplastic-like isoform X2 [Carex rostrata]
MKAILCNCPSLLNSRATDRSCSVSGAHKVPSRVVLRSSYKCLAIASPFLGTDQLQSTVYRSGNNKRRSTVHKVKALWKPNQRGKIVLYFTTWWALNVVFNIYNKMVLNVFPFPWLTATLALAAGSIIMLCSWCMNFVKPPKVDSEFWLALLPVAIAHSVGHVAATVSMSKVAVSFTHIIKSSEPAFTVLVSTFMLGETFPTPVYLSLVPIIAGCSLAAATELNFDLVGFLGAIISNLAFVFRNIFSKRGMKGRSISGINYYACLSILSLLILTPFALLLEGPKLWAVGWQRALLLIGPDFIWWVVAQSVFYHLYNQFSYMSLDEISALSFSIGNTMKRISVILSSIIIFHTPVRPLNIIGAAIAIIGAYIYSQAG